MQSRLFVSFVPLIIFNTDLLSSTVQDSKLYQVLFALIIVNPSF